MPIHFYPRWAWVVSAGAATLTLLASLFVTASLANAWALSTAWLLVGSLLAVTGSLCALVLLGIKPGQTSPVIHSPARLVEECVGLLDELERASVRLSPDAAELARHVEDRLHEILARHGITLIDGDSTFDRDRHQPQVGAAIASPGTPIEATLRPGLVREGRVLRRALVRLATPTTPR